MTYVIDACVGFKWAIVEHDTPKARSLRDDGRNGVHELLTPDVFLIEFAHAITRAERQARVTPQQGAQFVTDVLQILPLLHASLPLLPQAYEISSQMRIGVYDCLYVALAEREKCELISADDWLVKNLGPSSRSSWLWRRCPKLLSRTGRLAQRCHLCVAANGSSGQACLG